MIRKEEHVMQSIDPPRSTAAYIVRGVELTTPELLAALDRHPSKPLILSYEGRDVLPGYHVTEVKSGTFEALDCGANREVWRETIVQLWDVPAEAGRTWMPTSLFLAIMRKVTREFKLGAKLAFEVSDGVRAIQLYRAIRIEEQDGVVRVQLTPQPSSCKPRDRWLEQQHASASPTQTSPPRFASLRAILVGLMRAFLQHVRSSRMQWNGSV